MKKILKSKIPTNSQINLAIRTAWNINVDSIQFFAKITGRFFLAFLRKEFDANQT